MKLSEMLQNKTNGKNFNNMPIDHKFYQFRITENL